MSNSSEHVISTQVFVLFCYSSAKGGLELNVFQLAKQLKKKGFVFWVVVKEGSPLEELCKTELIPFFSIKLSHPKFDFKGAKNLAKLLKTHQVKHIISCTSNTNYISAWITLLFAPSLSFHYYQQMQLGQPKKGLIHQIIHSAIKTWFAPLPYLAKQAVHFTTIKEDKVILMPLGIDYEYFQENKSEKVKARLELGLPTDSFIFALPGRFDPLKNQLLALEGFLLFESKYPGKALLVFAGEETLDQPKGYKKQVWDKIEEKNCKEKVIVLPFIKDIRLFFSSIDVALMCTSKETYGMVTLEAMAMGVPVIGAGSGGTEELLERGNLGALFEPDNAKSLSEKMEEVFFNFPLKEKTHLAIERVKGKYDFSQTIPILISRLN